MINGDFPQSPGELLRWLQKDPKAIAELGEQVRKNAEAKARITVPSADNFQDIRPTQGTKDKLITIPIQFTQTVEEPFDYAGGTASVSYSQGEITALKEQVAALTETVQELVSQFTRSNINPGGGT